MSNQSRRIVRYGISFKQKVVREIEEEGLLMSEASRRYGITGAHTIEQWIRKFGKHQLLNKIVRVETMEEKDQVKKMEEEIRKLKLALADSLMAQKCLEVVIKEADKAYGTDLKKSFGEKPSQSSEKNSK